MPARTPARQVILLAALLVALAVLIVYQVRGTSGAAPGRPAEARPEIPRQAAAPREEAGPVPALRLQALRALGTAPPPAIVRNPFEEGRAAPPAKAPAVPVAGAAAGSPALPLPPPLPPITLKLVAIIRGAGRPVAALTDGRDVFYGHEGEVVEGRYKIVRINAESVDVAYVDGRGQRRIGLAG